MPAIVVLGRRWYFAGDDLVIPAFCDMLFRIAWIFVSMIQYWKNEEMLDGCDNVIRLKIFIGLMVLLLMLICIIDVVAISVSKRGGVMDIAMRESLPSLIYARMSLTVIEMLCAILGTVWTARGELYCEHLDWTAVVSQGLTWTSWSLIIVQLTIITLVYNTGGKHFNQIDINEEYASGKVMKHWRTRFLRMSCLCCCASKEEREAINVSSTVIGSIFEDADLVPSDILCGLILLSYKHMEERQNSRQSTKCDPEKVSEAFCMKMSKETKSKKLTGDNWDSLEMIETFSHYAVGSYSYPAYMGKKRMLCCKVLQKISCCPCFSGGADENIEGDFCCFLKTNAFKYFIKGHNYEIVHLSFIDNVFEVPFMVVLDHDLKAIILAIRGTMSVKDILTDLACMNERIPGADPSFKAHKGFLLCAQNLIKKLETMKLLKNLQAKYPNYTLVATGTSLGSAISVLMGIMLRKEFPNLKVYAYCPSGATVSLEAAKYCESFVLSIVYGDDIVPRLSVKSVEKLKYDIMASLYQCKLPKYRILLGALAYIIGIKQNVPYDFSKSKDIDSSIKRINYDEEASYERSTHRLRSESPSSCSSVAVSETSLENESYPIGHVRIPVVKKLSKIELMYIAGRILYITETKDFSVRWFSKLRSSSMRWTLREADRSEFREIKVTSRLLLDHIPFRLPKALKILRKDYYPCCGLTDL